MTNPTNHIRWNSDPAQPHLRLRFEVDPVSTFTTLHEELADPTIDNDESPFVKSSIDLDCGDGEWLRDALVDAYGETEETVRLRAEVERLAGVVAELMAERKVA